jgi:uncharacterized protein YegP (UPF0339 family)
MWHTGCLAAATMTSTFRKGFFAAVAALSLALPIGGCSDVETGDEQNATATKASFEIFQSEVDGKWYFHLLGKNGQIVLRSQAYTKESSAKNGIKSVQSNGVDVARFAIETAEGGQFYFNLLAGNNKIIATSETYSSKSNAERARDNVVDALTQGATVKNAELEGTGFQIFKCDASKKQYCFRLRANNGEIVLSSESYKTEAAAKKGVDSVKKNGPIAAQFEMVVGESEQTWFRLRASSAVGLEAQEIIGRSQVYTSQHAALAGMHAVIKLLVGPKECLFADDGGNYSVFEEVDGLEYGPEVDLDAESDLTSLEHNQIWASVNHHFPGDVDTDEQDVFSFFDESSLVMRSIEDTKTGRKYTAFEFTAGETPLATIFEEGSDEKVVMTAGDQSIESCTAN